MPLAATDGAQHCFLRLPEGNDWDPEQVEPGARGLSLVGTGREAVRARERARPENAHPRPGTEEENHRLASFRAVCSGLRCDVWWSWTVRPNTVKLLPGRPEGRRGGLLVAVPGEREASARDDADVSTDNTEPINKADPGGSLGGSKGAGQVRGVYCGVPTPGRLLLAVIVVYNINSRR